MFVCFASIVCTEDIRPPNVTLIMPNKGPLAGGSQLRLIGEDLIPGVVVRLRGTGLPTLQCSFVERYSTFASLGAEYFT